MQQAELQRWVEHCNLRHARTSAWSIGQQIEHCCLVTEGVQRALQASSPPVPRARRSLVRLAVFTTGHIPRGRAKAGKSVHPEDGPDVEHLQAALQRAASATAGIHALPTDAWFRHFVFDVLKRDETLKFLRIHTDHHLRIIRQIAQRCDPSVCLRKRGGQL